VTRDPLFLREKHLRECRLWEDTRSQLKEEEKGENQKHKEILKGYYSMKILVAAHVT